MTAQLFLIYLNTWALAKLSVIGYVSKNLDVIGNVSDQGVDWPYSTLLYPGLLSLFCSRPKFFFLSLAGNLRKTIKMMKEFFSVTREMNELGVLREDLDIRNSK